jgi:hypothetical protein
MKLTENMLCRVCSLKQCRDNLIENAKKNGVNFYQIQEYESICFITDIIKEDFYVKYLDEGCHADLAIKPKNIEENLWCRIQMKSTKQSIADEKYAYKFSVHKNYMDMILLCVCVKDDKIWSVDPDLVKDLAGFQIVEKDNTKYFKFKINVDDLSEHLFKKYESLPKFTLDIINIPITDLMKQEQEFRKLREQKLDFIKFERPHMNCMVYDFKINNYKIQEKVISNNNHVYLHKSDGANKKKAYNRGDNDFYWIHLKDKRYFYVIPEKILIDHEFITTETQIGKSGLIIHASPYYKDPTKNKWINDYIYDYENLNKEKLIELFS